MADTSMTERVKLALRLKTDAFNSEIEDLIIKSIKKIAEDTKVAVRNARRDAMDMIKDLEKEGEISEDERSRYEGDIQKIVDEACQNIDTNFDAKEKEIMEV